MKVRFVYTGIAVLWMLTAWSQEVYFFSEGTDSNFYDQGIVNVGTMGASFFEHTHPPGGPQWNDKIPCSPTAYRGTTSLKFNYTSAASGNWRAIVYRKGWATADVRDLDSISFYVWTEAAFPPSAHPLIGITAPGTGTTGDLFSGLYKLSDFNGDIPAKTWTRVSFPLKLITGDPQNSQLNMAAVKGVVFSQSEKNGLSRQILIDEIVAFKSMEVVPAVTDLIATGYDSHAELRWDASLQGVTYRVRASYDSGASYTQVAETDKRFYLHFVPASSKNSTVRYRVSTVVQGKESDPVEAVASIRDFTDEELLDMYQRYTFRYFWEGAHQESGMALERSDGNGRTVASGATGMGLMAMIAAYEREYRPREDIKDRILKILGFLEQCDRHQGAWSHWYNGDTYRTQPFSANDNGGDIVETSFVAQGLIALKNYFDGTDQKSVIIRTKADQLWRGINWNWYQNGGQNVLFWHWSPDKGFVMNMKVTGWNEALITYILAAASPTHPVPAEVYDYGWAGGGRMVSRRTFYGQEINLSPDWGGPLFWIHYSHLGINPRGLKDKYADYWKEHVNTARIHHAYAVANPYNFPNYGASNWGLTASDDPYGYTAHEPVNNDNGTISPTAALASMPYTPGESIQALKYFYRERGHQLFGIYGPYDAFNDKLNWVKESYIGIDQGPIMVMIENYRTGLLWKTVMKDSDVQAGLTKLGFQYEIPTGVPVRPEQPEAVVYPNPAVDRVWIDFGNIEHLYSAEISLYSSDGRVRRSMVCKPGETLINIDIRDLIRGFYIVEIRSNGRMQRFKLLVQSPGG